MPLSEEEKQKIKEEEEYRASVRSEHSSKQEIIVHHKKGHGCLIAFLLIIFTPIILIAFVSANNPTEDTDIGKHAYNSTNGVYRGKILERKDCSSDSRFKCFVVENEGTTMEAPVVNVDIKENPPENP